MFISDFEIFLRKHIQTENQRQMDNNTVMKYIERLKKMIKMAIRYEWIEKDPFIAFQQKFQHVERGYLTEEELKKIEEKSFSIPILPIAMEIIEKYKNDSRAIIQNRIFPNIANQKLNSYIRRLLIYAE